MCVRQHGDAPEVTLHGRLDLTFAYVAEHVHYILLELLKNSMRCVRRGVVLLLAWWRPAVHSTHPPNKNKKQRHGGVPRHGQDAAHPDRHRGRGGQRGRRHQGSYVHSVYIHTLRETTDPRSFLMIRFTTTNTNHPRCRTRAAASPAPTSCASGATSSPPRTPPSSRSVPPSPPPHPTPLPL